MTSPKNSGLFFCLLFFPVLLTFVSCSARIEGVVREGGSAELSLSMSLEPRTVALIRSLQSFMGDEGAEEPVLDGPSIARSMAAAPGVRSVILRNTGPSALEGTVSIYNIGNFLVEGLAEDRFIRFTEGRGAGNSSIVITLDRNSAPLLISRLSPEIEDYLSSFFAPVVLGETSTVQEYLDLLAQVYGRPLANEVAAARIRARIQFPRPITSIQGGTASGRFAEFDVPLVDILVLERPLRYEVRW